MKKITILILLIGLLVGCGANDKMPEDNVIIPNELAETKGTYTIESGHCFYTNTEYYEDVYCGGTMKVDVRSNVEDKEKVYFDLVLEAYDKDSKKIGTYIQKSRLFGTGTKTIKINNLPFNNVSEYKVRIENYSKNGDENKLGTDYTYDYSYVDYLYETNKIENGLESLSNKKESADKVANLFNAYCYEYNHFKYISKTTENGVTFYKYSNKNSTSKGYTDMLVRFKNNKFYGITLLDSEMDNYGTNFYPYKEIATVLIKIYNEQRSDIKFNMAIGISSKDYKYEGENYSIENSNYVNIFTLNKN